MSTKERSKKATDNNDLFRDKPKHPNKKLRVTLPICPSVNHLHYGKSMKLTAQARKYIMNASALIRLAIEEQKWIPEEGDVWMYMDLTVYMPDRKIRDSHNMLKLMIDVFQGIAFHNDYFVMPRIQGVEYDTENPRIEACITFQTENDRKKVWN